jgi:membrane associated rhomboid family serine protease
MLLIALLTVLAVAVYVMSPDERRRALAAMTGRGGAVRRAIRTNLEACAPWLDALRARAGQPVVAFAIAFVYLAAFGALLSGTAPHAAPETLLGWGATFGPRTSNGEWWRLFTAIFLHQGFISLVVDAIVVIELGAAVERIFGHVAFGAVFVASGVLANTIHLASHPVAVRTGASGALYGLYGLLIVWAIQGARAPSDLTIPRPGYRLLAPVAALFIVTSMLSDTGALIANLAALAVGVVSAATLVGAVQEGSRAPGRIAAVAGSTLAVIMLMAVPSIGTTDVRPEIARVIELEGRTAAPYANAVAQFKLGATSAQALADMIDGRILPEMREAETRLDRLRGVPPEYRGLVADAQRYVRLRSESWNLRARALRASSTRALRLADGKERESLDAFDQLKAAATR